MENTTFKTQAEQRDAFFESMVNSVSKKVALWKSLGFSRAEAIAQAKSQSCAGAKVWERIEASV